MDLFTEGWEMITLQIYDLFFFHENADDSTVDQSSASLGREAVNQLTDDAPQIHFHALVHSTPIPNVIIVSTAHCDR
jgi:hypothetical protein